MTWSRAFPKALTLANGRVITTLREAGELILGLPDLHRANGHWQGAMELLMAAAEDPAAEALNRAARKFSIALRAEKFRRIVKRSAPTGRTG